MINTEEQGSTSVSGEKKLIAAMIRAAVDDCIRKGAAGIAPNKHMAGEWWMFKENVIRPFSFLWCCEALDLDPEYVRGMVRAEKLDFDIGKIRKRRYNQ